MALRMESNSFTVVASNFNLLSLLRASIGNFFTDPLFIVFIKDTTVYSILVFLGLLKLHPAIKPCFIIIYALAHLDEV